MALILKDRVQETSTTTGTGTLTLAGAVTQFQTFSSAIGNGNTTYYTIYNAGGSLWEVGIGTVGAGTLSRDTVLSSSNAGSLVSFTGTLYVFGDYPAGKSVYLDAIGTATVPQLATSSTTNTTPVLSYNASNSNYAAGATVSGSYLQTVMQNKSGTAGASTNFAVSNDLGTDSTYYGEFGMNSSVYSAGTPADFFSLNNGIYYSGHDGDVTLGSGNGKNTYLAWGTTGQSAHVINATGSIGLNTNITGTSNFGTSGQVLTSAGNAASPTWTTPTTGTVTSVTGTAPVVSSGGNTPAISMAAANTTTNGYLTSTDWNTFNGKGSGTVTSVGGTGTVNGITLTGTVTSSGNLTLGGTLSNVSLTTQVTGTLPAGNGGTGLTSPGTSGNVLTSNGSAWVSSAPVTGGLSWQSVQTSNFTAVAGNGYPVNTTSGAITVTLPASPSAGNFITLSDYAGTFATNNLTINPNGKNLNGASTNKLLINNRYSVNLVYIDATQGWISYADNTTTPSNPPYTATYLIAAGGGSGGNAPSGDGGQGGGGAGGLLTGTTTVTVGTTYSFVVGGGGATNTNGSDSTGFGLTAIGGGKGGQPDATPGSAGGSGGGGSENGSPAGGAGTSGQGNSGGAGGPTIVGGGGGGAGAAGTAGYYSGSNNGANYGGPGGAGSTTSLITTSQATSASVGQVVSSSVYFCGGGGASMYVGWTPASNSGSPGSGGGGQGAKNSTNATAGSANSGGGGGGLGSSGSGATTGGSGVVLLSVPTASYSGTYTGSSVSVVTNGSNTVLIFKSSGSYTA
jgi:hypothetical protein